MLSPFRRRLTAIIITTLILLGPLLSVSWPVWAEPADDLNTDSLTQSLADELLLLDLQLWQLRSEEEQLQKEITRKKNQLPQLEQTMAETKKDLARHRQLLGEWVRFTNENGSVFFLEVLLGASDMSDFITRAEFVSLIIDYSLQLWQQTAALSQAMEEQHRQLARTTSQLEQMQQNLEQNITEISRLRQDRQAALEQARRLGVDVVELASQENQWVQAFTPLDYLLRHWAELPWDSLESGHLSFDYRQAAFKLVITDTDLSSFISGSLPLLNGVTITAQPANSFLITTPGAVQARLTGRLIVGEPGKVQLVPASLEVEGTTVNDQVFYKLMSKYQLSVDFPAFGPGLALTSINTDGHLIELVCR